MASFRSAGNIMTLRIALVLSGVLFLVETGFAQPIADEVLPTPAPLGSSAGKGPDKPIVAAERPAGQVITSSEPVYTIPYGFPGSPQRWWSKADYMMTWLRGRNLPPLVTTSVPGTPREDAGVIGEAGTSILFGGDQLNGAQQAGGRVEVGRWFADDFAYAVGCYIINGQDNRFSATSTGTPILGRPFIDADTGQFEAALIAFPALYNGSIRINATADEFASVHLNLRERFYSDETIQAEAIIGYRYFHYGESVDIDSNFITNEAPAPPGTQLLVTDRFTTNNDFHGGDAGVRVEMASQRWSLELLGKVAVGSMYRRIIIQGSTTTTVQGQDPVTSDGGLLALASNIGTFRSTNWVAIPEIGATVGYQLTDRLRFRLGYTFLMLTQLARAGDQIDITVNQDLLPGPDFDPDAEPRRPAFGLRTTDMWIQSLNFGLEYRF